MNKYKIITDSLKSLRGVCVVVLKLNNCDISESINMYEERLLKCNKFKKLLDNLIIPSSRYIQFDINNALDYDYFKNININDKVNTILKTLYFTLKFSTSDTFNHISEGDILMYVSLINTLTVMLLLSTMKNDNDTISIIFRPIFERFINTKSQYTDQMITYHILKNMRHDNECNNYTLKNIIKEYPESLLTYDEIK